MTKLLIQETKTNYQLPETEQGLNDFIRYAHREIKRSDKQVKELNQAIDAAYTQLTIKGWGHTLPERGKNA